MPHDAVRVSKNKNPTHLYGYVDRLNHSILPKGSQHWFSSRYARDVHMREAKGRAKSDGYIRDKIRTAIYPIRIHVGSIEGREHYKAITAPNMPGIVWHG